MFDIIKQFFAFLFPVLKQAVIQAAADELNQVAYPTRRRMDVGYGPTSYNRIRSSYDRRGRTPYDTGDLSRRSRAPFLPPRSMMEADLPENRPADERHEDDSVTYTFPVQVHGNISRDAALEALQHHVNTDTHPCFTYTINTVD